MSLYAINTERPFPISRADFQSAVDAAVVVALSEGAPISAAAALRDVGRTATVVGLNYEGCPLTLAGLYERYARRSMPTWAGRFVVAYDDALCKLCAFSAQMPSGYRATCLNVQD